MIKGEIYLVNLDGGVGCEQQGVRPCLVVQNDIGNKYSGTTIVCPVTTKSKNFNATHMKIEDLTSTSYIMFEQIRIVDKSRLIKYLCVLSDEQMREANNKMRIALSL
jgi:mRNA interferase MazF